MLVDEYIYQNYVERTEQQNLLQFDFSVIKNLFLQRKRTKKKSLFRKTEEVSDEIPKNEEQFRKEFRIFGYQALKQGLQKMDIQPKKNPHDLENLIIETFYSFNKDLGFAYAPYEEFLHIVERIQKEYKKYKVIIYNVTSVIQKYC